jgi:hypothetical protein
VIRLVIPEPTPSLNEIYRGRVPAWKTMKSLHGRWSKLLQVAIAVARAEGADVSPPAGRRRVTIERHSCGALDVDNLYGGLKVLLDELRAHDLIRNDDAKNIDLSARNVKSRRSDACTVVLLEDVKG